MEFLWDIGTDVIGQIYRAPAFMLLFLSLLAIGRLIKEIKWPPPRFIPLVLFFVSIAGAVVLGDPGAVSPNEPSPKTRLAFVGIVMWLLVWISHKLLLQYIEEWLMGKLKAVLPKSKAVIAEEGNGSPD